MSQQRRSRDTKDNEENEYSGTLLEFADSKIPDFKKRTGIQYIPFGQNNDYPSYLLELYNKSSKHSAIINGKVFYIIGKGLTSEDPSGQEFLKKCNPKQSWDDLSPVVSQDIENYGGFYLQVIPRLKGGYNYYHISYDKMRTNEENSKFFYRKIWENNYQTADKEFPAFCPGIKKASIYYYKEYRGKKSPYALPSWVAACNWIESDIEVSKATLTNAKSGFSASKFINFYNGEPDERKKKSIVKRLENAVSGAEGKKFFVGFNDDPAKKPTVEDLGASDLTKEDFTQVDNLITSNIFAGHSITHPLLFGIMQEGKLGGATELRVAYEVFKNTYVTSKQVKLEGLIKYFAKCNGVECDFKFIDVEPVGLQLTDAMIEKVAPSNWIAEKLGIDLTKYNIPGEAAGENMQSNSILTNLTGRQQQRLMAIVRLYTKGQLTKEQAKLQLKHGFGFNDEQINSYLGIEEDFSQEDFAYMFEGFGDERDQYRVIKSEIFMGGEEVAFAFKAATELNEVETNISKLIQEKPNITDEEIAAQTGIELLIVNETIKKLAEEGVIDITQKGGSVIRKIIKKDVKQLLPEMKVMYTYEKRPDVSGASLLPTSRPFCKKLVSMNKMFSREDIQKISDRLGYSVFKRAGGFWNNNGTIEWQCRHGWMRHVVVKK